MDRSRTTAPFSIIGSSVTVETTGLPKNKKMMNEPITNNAINPRIEPSGNPRPFSGGRRGYASSSCDQFTALKSALKYTMRKINARAPRPQYNGSVEVSSIESTLWICRFFLRFPYLCEGSSSVEFCAVYFVNSKHLPPGLDASSSWVPTVISPNVLRHRESRLANQRATRESFP